MTDVVPARKYRLDETSGLHSRLRPHRKLLLAENLKTVLNHEDASVANEFSAFYENLALLISFKIDAHAF